MDIVSLLGVLVKGLLHHICLQSCKSFGGYFKNNCHVMALQIIKKLYVTGLWRCYGTAIGMGILPIALISFPMWIGNSFENRSIERLNFFWSKYK